MTPDQDPARTPAGRKARACISELHVPAPSGHPRGAESPRHCSRAGTCTHQTPRGAVPPGHSSLAGYKSTAPGRRQAGVLPQPFGFHLLSRNKGHGDSCQEPRGSSHTRTPPHPTQQGRDQKGGKENPKFVPELN